MKKLCLVLVFALLVVGAAFAVEPAGEVTEVVPRSMAKRGSTETPLAPRSEIFERDVLTTDAGGRLEVTFRDGTLLSVGPQSEVDVREFAMGSEKNVFQSDILKGAARVVTGELVKRNPGGFKISTPRSTIGIRGTTVLFVVRGGDEVVAVQSLGSDAPAGAHVTVIDKERGGVERIDEAGLAFVRRRGGAGAVSRLDEKQRAALDSLAGYTRPGRTGDAKQFNELVDTVLGGPSKAPQPTKNPAVRTPSSRSGILDGEDVDGPATDRPTGKNENVDGGPRNIEPPSPRQGEGCP